MKEIPICDDLHDLPGDRPPYEITEIGEKAAAIIRDLVGALKEIIERADVGECSTYLEEEIVKSARAALSRAQVQG